MAKTGKQIKFVDNGQTDESSWHYKSTVGNGTLKENSKSYKLALIVNKYKHLENILFKILKYLN